MLPLGDCSLSLSCKHQFFLIPHHLIPHPPPTLDRRCPLSHLLARQDVASQLDLGKVSLADGLEQTVVADVRLLVGARGDGIPAPGAQRATGLAGGLVCTAGPQWHMLEEKCRKGVTYCANTNIA